MAWPWLTIIAKSIPWAELVRRTPEILQASRKLLDKNRRTDQPAEPPAPTYLSREELAEKIAELDARDQAHAEILTQMSAQLQGLTHGLEIVAARNRLLSVFVVILAIALIVSVILR